MMPDVDELERAVLAAFVSNEKDDPDGAWAAYHPTITAAADGVLTYAVQVCRKLRERKLLAGEGRGEHATYWPTDKGRERAAAAELKKGRGDG